jgi:ADP-ribose pyrophosphatase
LLEPGEDPDECARRELLEETGCRALNLVPLGALCASPGYTTERVLVYFADVEDPEKDLQLDEDENIEVVMMTEDEVCDAIKSGSIEDSKTLAMWLLYQLKIKKQGK